MRDVTSGYQSAIEAGVVRPAFFVSAEFNSGSIYVWSGMGSIDWDGHTWLGVGTLGKISQIQETGELRANSVAISLSAIPSLMLSTVMAEIRQGLPCKVYLVLFGDDGNIIDAPYEAFGGRIDTGQIQEGADTSTAILTVESELVDFQRLRDRHYSDQDQQQLFPGDLGFIFVPQIQNFPGAWGRK